MSDINAQKESALAQLRAVRDARANLNNQMDTLSDQAEASGATEEEIAEARGDG